MYKLLLVVIIVFIPNKGYCDEYDITLSRNDFDLKGPVVKVTIKDCQFKEEFGELIRSGSKDKNIFFYGNGNVYKIVNSPNTYRVMGTGTMCILIIAELLQFRFSHTHQPLAVIGLFA